MARDRAKLDRSRDFAENTGPGTFYHFSQDEKYFGADEVEIFPSELLNTEQDAVPTAAKAALEESKGFIARVKEEADRWHQRFDESQKDVARLQALVDAAAGVDVGALTQQLADAQAALAAKEVENAALQDSAAKAAAAVAVLQQNADDKDRELTESRTALEAANAAIAELRAAMAPPADPPVSAPASGDGANAGAPAPGETPAPTPAEPTPAPEVPAPAENIPVATAAPVADAPATPADAPPSA